MKIVSKFDAMRLHHQHPHSCTFRYCTGRYQWHGSADHYTGQEVPDVPCVPAVYAERDQGRNSPYVCLMSITLN